MNAPTNVADAPIANWLHAYGFWSGTPAAASARVAATPSAAMTPTPTSSRRGRRRLSSDDPAVTRSGWTPPMAAATPRALPVVEYSSTGRYEGYRYVTEHPDEVAAFFAEYL